MRKGATVSTLALAMCHPVSAHLGLVCFMSWSALGCSRRGCGWNGWPAASQTSWLAFTTSRCLITSLLKEACTCGSRHAGLAAELQRHLPVSHMQQMHTSLHRRLHLQALACSVAIAKQTTGRATHPAAAFCWRTRSSSASSMPSSHSSQPCVHLVCQRPPHL